MHVKPYFSSEMTSNSMSFILIAGPRPNSRQRWRVVAICVPHFGTNYQNETSKYSANTTQKIRKLIANGCPVGCSYSIYPKTSSIPSRPDYTMSTSITGEYFLGKLFCFCPKNVSLLSVPMQMSLLIEKPANLTDFGLSQGSMSLPGVQILRLPGHL